MYALPRVSEAELLFGRPSFVLPIVPVAHEISAKRSLPDSSTLVASITGEPLGQSPIGETKTPLEPETSLVSGDQPPAEPETSLELGDGLETGDRMVMEPKDHLESGAADLLEPIGEDLDPNMVIDSLGAETLEELQPETRNSLLGCGEANTSRPGALIGSLREGLLACPLETLMEVLPDESSSVAETRSSGELAEAILHAQLQVSFMS
jgi:hypothetical protein